MGVCAQAITCKTSGDDKLKKFNHAGSLIGCLFLYLPVAWAALLLAQSLGGGLPEVLERLTVAIQNPLQIRWTDKSF